MNYLQAVILSLVEGVTEFLPISSTGHLILTSHILGLIQTEFLKSFEIAIQLGAILAIVVLYWQTLWHKRTIWLTVLTAFIPTGLIGWLVYPAVKSIFFESPLLIVTSLFVGGLVMLVFEKRLTKSTKTTKIQEIGFGQALIIGLLQSVSVIPGVSRAMATIFGGLGVGLNKKTATEFSFLLAVPTMLAATGYDLLKTNVGFTEDEYLLLLVGFVVSFLSALLIVKWLVNFVASHSFRLFAFYRILLAVIFWIIY